jgi:uridine kinase
LIVEGVYAQQPARASGLPSYAIFIEAEQALIERWYTQRFLRLHAARYADTSQALRRAAQLYAEVNYANYVTCIAPLRSSADLVLHKSGAHEFFSSQELSARSRRVRSARPTSTIDRRPIARSIAQASTGLAFG